MLAFKYPSLIHHWHSMHPRFIEVVEWIDHDLWHGYLHEPYMVVTSLFRADGDSTHGFYRAGDFRVRVGGRSGAPFIQLERLQDLEQRIKREWYYGDSEQHQVAYLHGKLYPKKQKHLRGEEHLHFHIQVRDETARRQVA